MGHYFNQRAQHMDNSVTAKPSTEGTAKLVYILYLAGIVFGITGTCTEP